MDGPVLGFDTSGPWVTAAVVRAGTLSAHRHEDMDRGQAERLMGLIEEVLEEAGETFATLARIGVGVGPGNFTGIRISVSAARGLSMGLGIPAVGISTLEAMAWGTGGVCGVIIDARGGRTYQQRFTAGFPDFDPTLCEPGEVMPLNPKSEPSVIGHDAERIAKVSGGIAGAPCFPLAEAIARKAAARVGKLDAPPAPLYIRPADAAPPRDPGPVILRP